MHRLQGQGAVEVVVCDEWVALMGAIFGALGARWRLGSVAEELLENDGWYRKGNQPFQLAPGNECRVPG